MSAVLVGALTCGGLCRVRGEGPEELAIARAPSFVERAHSHNDYAQKRPLLDAVEAGLSSVEADLWLESGKLMVGHDRGKWRGEFEALYLNPLAELWVDRKLPVGRGNLFLLWLDIKDDSRAFRASLRELLGAQACLQTPDPTRPTVRVILTGNKQAKEAYVEDYPSESATRDSNTFRDDDPKGSQSWSWYALDWKKLSTWNGVGEFPPEDRARLRELVANIHNKERQLRLWNHPATRRFWEEAVAAGVDRIGVDAIPRQ